MLKLLIVLLLLVNGAYFAWTAGALGKTGLAPAQQAEPERLQQQRHAERLRVTPAAPALPADAASAPAR
jgi:hypothetical protein